VLEDPAQRLAHLLFGAGVDVCLVALLGGRSVLNIVATSPSGATARQARTVVVLAATAPVIFDGRNLFTPGQMKQNGFTYYSIGRH